jgi:sRNA-binding regulator protein Hfq
MNWRTNKSMLEVKLFEGESFFGTLEWFDQYTLGFKGWSKSAEQTTSQMILIPKHAVIYMREHKQPPSGLT